MFDDGDRFFVALLCACIEGGSHKPEVALIELIDADETQLLQLFFA